METDILNQSALKPPVWKRFIDDDISLWNTTREEITQFIEQANNTIKLSGLQHEVSETQTNLLDTTDKGERFKTESVLDAGTHLKPIETFQHIHFSTCRPTGVKRGFIKGEALRLLRTNTSKALFEESVPNFKTHLLERGYPENFIQTTLSEVTLKTAINPSDQKNKNKNKKQENLAL